MKVSDMMNPNMYIPINRNYPNYQNQDRFVGSGFLAPFILGGITGGLLAPSFYPRPVPIIYNPPIYRPYPVPYYQNNYQVYY